MIGYALGALRLDFSTAVVAVGYAGSRKEHAQVVHYIGHSAYRRAGVLADRFLFDGDGGAEPADVVDLRFLHLAQELTGVGGEALHIPALTLGVERVEGQR